MKTRYALPVVGLIAVAGALGACSDEKKKEPTATTQPAPAADPAKPADPAVKPAEPMKPADKH